MEAVRSCDKKSFSHNNIKYFLTLLCVFQQKKFRCFDLRSTHALLVVENFCGRKTTTWIWNIWTWNGRNSFIETHPAFDQTETTQLRENVWKLCVDTLWLFFVWIFAPVLLREKCFSTQVSRWRSSFRIQLAFLFLRCRRNYFQQEVLSNQ